MERDRRLLDRRHDQRRQATHLEHRQPRGRDLSYLRRAIDSNGHWSAVATTLPSPPAAARRPRARGHRLDRHWQHRQLGSATTSRCNSSPASNTHSRPRSARSTIPCSRSWEATATRCLPKTTTWPPARGVENYMAGHPSGTYYLVVSSYPGSPVGTFLLTTNQLSTAQSTARLSGPQRRDPLGDAAVRGRGRCLFQRLAQPGIIQFSSN